MEYKYYSQHGEDYLLWEFFDRKPDGFYVDVGAFDGVHLSNSYSFELAGWDGICIEPHPKYFPLCKSNRPNSKCLEIACGSKEYVVDFMAEDIGLLSGINVDENDLKKRYRGRKLEYPGVKNHKVICKPLSNVLPNRHINFISIDVEGHELDVLSGMDLKSNKPDVIVAEANSNQDKTKLISFLSEFGYIHARSINVNCFFVKTVKDSNKIRAIKIQCTIEKQMHPLGKDYTIKSRANKK